MAWLSAKLGLWLAQYLNRPIRKYRPYSISDPEYLRRVLRPGDVVLVEGHYRISQAIKYLTQSTWSHAAIYIGDALGQNNDRGEPLSLVEADLEFGVHAIALSSYADFNTRICRPVNLTPADQQQLVNFMIKRLGHAYDLQNVIDLMRYLLPTPPVPVRWRRRMLAMGSGDPSRAICSTLIAEGFQNIRYPILPEITVQKYCSVATREYTEKEIMHIRHHSLYAPRDFDLSPYFEVIKPTIEAGFNYKGVHWHDRENRAVEPKSLPRSAPK